MSQPGPFRLVPLMDVHGITHWLTTENVKLTDRETLRWAGDLLCGLPVYPSQSDTAEPAPNADCGLCREFVRALPPRTFVR